MKKMFLVLSIVLVIGQVCFALEPITVSSSVSEAKAFTGKVESVSLVNPAEGKKAEIVVVTDKAEKMSFVVPSGIDISDKDGKLLSLKKIKPDDLITVEYSVTKTKVNKAMSITVGQVK